MKKTTLPDLPPIVRRRSDCTVLFLFAILFAPAVEAQVPQPFAGQFGEPVSLDVDNTVVKKLGSVKDYLSEQRWTDAVMLLQDIAETQGTTLISVEPRRYVNVARYCNLVLSELPAEGLSVYRQQVDSQARSWFEEARSQRDPATLKKLLRNAFASSYGDDALWTLAQWAWDEGELATARTYWQMLLPRAAPQKPHGAGAAAVLRYPETDYDLSLIRARLVLTGIMQQNRQRAQAELAQFERTHADAEGRLAGRRGNLLEILRDVFTDSRDWRRRAAASPISTFGGNAGRNYVSPEPLDVGAARSAPLKRDRFVNVDVRPAMPSRGPLSYFPVAWNDVVLLNDAESIYAYDLTTGKPAWPVDDGSAVIYPSLPGNPRRPSRPCVGVPRYTMTVHEGRLYARMGPPVTQRAEHEFRADNELVCLDLRHGQGKLVWKVEAAELQERMSSRQAEIPPEAGQTPNGGVTQWAFEGSPVADGSRLYVAMRHNHPNTQAAVACLDAETGRFLWKRFVCSAVAGFESAYNFISHHLLTLGGDSVFYCTEMGAIAALDRTDGTPKWIATYTGDEDGTVEHLSDDTRQGLLPCLFHDGTLVVAPAGSHRLLAFDAHTGVRKWTRRLPDRLRHLLGAQDGILVVSGDELWGLRLDTGRLQWRHGLTGPAASGYGRGLLVSGRVYWPTHDAIYVIDQVTGRRVRQPVLLRPRNTGGGNLAIAGNVLLIAQPDRLTALGESAGASRPDTLGGLPIPY